MSLSVRCLCFDTTPIQNYNPYKLLLTNQKNANTLEINNKFLMLLIVISTFMIFLIVISMYK